jgi:hypothetical protein
MEMLLAVSINGFNRHAFNFSGTGKAHADDGPVSVFLAFFIGRSHIK